MTILRGAFRRNIALAAMATSLFAAETATAQQAPTPGSRNAVATLMKSLRDKGILSEAEYQMMVDQLDASPPQAVASTDGQGDQQQTPVLRAAPVSGTATQPATAVAVSDAAAGTVAVRAKTGSGLSLVAGDVTATLHGAVNGFYTHVSGSPDIPANRVAGGTAAIGPNSSAIRSGFVPGYLTLDVTTQQSGFDIGTHFGFYPGINSAAGQPNLVGVPQAFNVGGMDIRQINLTISRPDLGELKIGRDIGLFAQDAALKDFALLGMGTPPANAAPTNSTLGRIGTGYIYVDFIPQITYTTPSIGGFKASVGIFQPLTTFGQDEVNGTPGFQARLAYDYAAGDVTAQLWSSGIIQRHDATVATGGRSYTGKGVDFGAKLGYQGLALTGSYFTASGLGIAGLFDAPLGTNLGTRNSRGFYIQPTYKIGKFLLGGSYGSSWLDLAENEPVSNVVRSNTSWYGGVRYMLTSWTTLSGEYVSTRSEAHNGNRAVSDAIIVGAIVAF